MQETQANTLKEEGNALYKNADFIGTCVRWVALVYQPVMWVLGSVNECSDGKCDSTLLCCNGTCFTNQLKGYLNARDEHVSMRLHPQIL